MRARRTFLLLAAGLALSGVAIATPAATPPLPHASPTAAWTSEWIVGSVLSAGGHVYLGGSFQAVGPPGGPLLPFRLKDGTVDRKFPRISGGYVSAIEPDGLGGWFLGGNFQYVGSAACKDFAHLRASGALDRAWCAEFDGSVGLIARAGRRLYVNGAFTHVRGVARRWYAAVDTRTRKPTRWRVTGAGHATVKALVAGAGSVFVGGSFSSLGGRSVHDIAALDATTGKVSGWRAGLDRSTCSTRGPCDTPVGALAVAGRTLYAAGSFDLVHGKSRVGLAALDARTGRPRAWRADVDRGALSVSLIDEWRLLASRGVVIVAGPFERIGRAKRVAIAALDAGTGLVRPWRPRLPGDAEIMDVSASSSSFVIGYDRALAETWGVRAVDRSTGRKIRWSRTDFCCAGNFGVAAASGSHVLISSSLGVLGHASRNGLAAFDPKSGRMLSWAPRPNGTTYTMAASGSTLYVAGGFTRINGQSRNRLAAFDLKSGKLLAWNPNADEDAYTLAVDGSTVYVSGDFSTIGGKARAGLAAVDATTGAVTDWDPRPGGDLGSTVYQLAVRGSTVYAAGPFTTIGGAARNHLAALDRVTGAAQPWDPQVDGTVHDLATGTNGLFVGGEFTHVGTAERHQVAEIAFDTGSATAFDAGGNFNVSAESVLVLHPTSSILFVGGDWDAKFGTEDRSGIVALDAVTGRLLNWKLAEFPGYAFSFAHDDRRLYVGGRLFISGGNGFLVFRF